MLEIVVKRDGREVNFDIDKIKTALKKAFAEVDQTDIDDVCDDDATSKLIDKIANEIAHGGNKKMSVEQIQDIVESKLMCSHRKDVAKAYILYRNERTKIRNNNSEFMKVISEKLMASNVQNQNANVDEHSFGGRKGEADSELMRRYALDNCMSEMAKMNHLNNEIYIHDLDSYAVGMHNCLSIPFDDLLAKGFNTRQTDVRPAKSINTALQLVAVISQLQSLQQFGGVSATHLDWTLVPYFRMSLFKHYLMNYVEDTDDFLSLDLVSMDEEEIDDWVDAHKEKYLSEMGLTSEDFYIGNDKLDKRLYQRALLETRKETYQAIEGLYHNLNTLQSRSGNQLPFTSINYGTCTLPEGRIIIKALLEVSIHGIGKLNKTPIFPCGIFQIMKGVNDKPGTPNYDLYRLALKSTSLRLYPNYANVDWSGNAGYDPNDPRTIFSTMGKRNTTAHLKPFEPRQRVSALAG